MTVQTLLDGPGATIHLHDYQPAVEDFRGAVVAGLSEPLKRLPCKFLYDDLGSQLFERICRLDEYYPTRTELRIMRRHAAEMAAALGPRCLLVEYGSGSSLKTRLLLDRLRDPAGYVPIDISRVHLLRAARGLAAAYPGLDVRPVCADYTAAFRLPAFARPASSVVAYFPGSTIGNFEPAEAVEFLANVRRTCGPGSGLLIGVDLKKDPALLHAAYNDAAGITAAFNLNLLRRINAELGGTFDEGAFRHYACYNPPAGRVEMHLVSLAAQHADVDGVRFRFEQGETVHTENCYKYTLAQVRALAERAGYRLDQTWLDEREWFSVHHLQSR